MTLHKDLALDRLAEVGNVAQFVAFRPTGMGGLDQTTSRVAGHAPNAVFDDVGHGASVLLASSADGAVNVRSYLPDDPRSREFVYGIRSVADAVDHVRRLAADGLHLILNETIDVSDGGVSGVAQGALIEFAPDDTPRAVEKPGAASLPREMGISILRTVYGFEPDLPAGRDRVEFSVHPAPRGWRRTNTLLWEWERGPDLPDAPPPRWPNRFSRHIGDKAFGLLVADQLGAPVPATTVVARRVAPFSFGRETGLRETWIRTCPREPRPGLYTTSRGWSDPFRLLADEDGEGEIASVLAQQGVRAAWSGAAILGAAGELIVEGRAGEGDRFMLGEEPPQDVPQTVLADVSALHRRLSDSLGPVRMEWVHDGDRVWTVQLHVGATGSSGLVIVEGEAERWIPFETALGLVELRRVIAAMPDGAGLELRGSVGLTSHVADVVRKWARPARIAQGGREPASGS